MKRIIFRDDDISYFTPVEWLQILYEPILDRRLPVALSVIPEIRADVQVSSADDRSGHSEQSHFEPFIPPPYRGKEAAFSIADHLGLLQFVEKYPQIEILQHGLSHVVIDGTKEFLIRDKTELHQRALRGRQLILDGFQQKPFFFTPPWDGISPEALEILRGLYSGVTRSAYSHHLLPFWSWPKFLMKKIRNRPFLTLGQFLIVEHPGTIFSRSKSKDEIRRALSSAMEKFDIVVLVNHHWEYFYDWGELNPSFYSAWQESVSWLLGRRDVQVVSFSQLYSEVLGITPGRTAGE